MNKDKTDREPLMSNTKQAGAASDDPFYAVRDNLQIFVDKIKLRSEHFQSIVKNTDTATNPEFKELRKALGKDIKSADRQIRDLKGAVDMVDKNREKFQHIKDVELNQRKKVVDEMQRVVNDVKAYLDSSAVRRKIEEDEMKLRRSEVEIAPTDIETGNKNFMKEQKLRTQEIMVQQDQSLEILGQAVGTLGVMSKDINEELKLQNKMLGNLEDDLDDAGNKMNFVMAKLSKLLKTKDGCQIWTIVILALILIGLVCLVIWV